MFGRPKATVVLRAILLPGKGQTDRAKRRWMTVSLGCCSWHQTRACSDPLPEGPCARIVEAGVMSMSGLSVGTILLLSVWSLWLLGACEQLGFHRARNVHPAWPVTVRLEPPAVLKPGWPARLPAVAAGLGLVLVPTSLVGWRTYLVVALAALAVIAAFAGGADAGQAPPAADRRLIPAKITRDQGRRLILSSVSLAGVVWLMAQGGGAYWDYLAEIRLAALVVVLVAVIVYGQILGVPELRRRRGAHEEEVRRLRKIHEVELAALMALPTRRSGYRMGTHTGAASDNGGRHHPPADEVWAGNGSRQEAGAHTAGRTSSQRSGAHGETPPDVDRVSAAPAGQSGPPGTPLGWEYHVPGDRGAGTGAGDSAARQGGLRLEASGDRELPPEAAAELVKARSELDCATTELPDDFDTWSRDAQLYLVAEMARRSSGRWPLVLGAAAGDADEPGEPEWKVVFAPERASGEDGAAPAALRPGAQTPSQLATAGRNDVVRDVPAQQGTSQTILLLDTLAIDTLLAAVLGTPRPPGADIETIRIIKIVIQPRGLMIMAVKVAVNAFLNAHGLGVLAPACGRVTTKVLRALLDYLLGPDRRFAELKKALDAFEEFLCAANGRPADSQRLRDQFAQWAAGVPRPQQDPTSKASSTGWRPAYRAPAGDSRSASDGWQDSRARPPYDEPGQSAAPHTASEEWAAPGHRADRPTSPRSGTSPAAPVTPAAHRQMRETSATSREDARTAETGEVHGSRPASDGTREPRTAGRDGAVVAPGGKARDLAAGPGRAQDPSAPNRDPIGGAFGAGKVRGVLPVSDEAREPGAASRDATAGTPAADGMSRLHASDETPGRGALGHPGATDTPDHRTEPGGKHLPTATGEHGIRGISSRDNTAGPPQPHEARDVVPDLGARRQSAAGRNKTIRSRDALRPTAEGRRPLVAGPDEPASTCEPHEMGNVSAPGEGRHSPADSPRELNLRMRRRPTTGPAPPNIPCARPGQERESGGRTAR
jgi:hypothetical protein